MLCVSLWLLPTTLIWPGPLLLLYSAPQFLKSCFPHRFPWLESAFLQVTCPAPTVTFVCSSLAMALPTPLPPNTGTPRSMVLPCIAPFPPSRTFGGQQYRCYRLNRKQSRHCPPEPVKGPGQSHPTLHVPSQTFTTDQDLYYSLGSLAWLPNTSLSVVLPNMLCLLTPLNSSMLLMPPCSACLGLEAAVEMGPDGLIVNLQGFLF